MTLLRLQLPAATLLLCLLAGCETSEPKKQSSVPKQAKAPQVTYSEDPRPKQPTKQAAQPQEAPQPKPAAPDAAETLIAQTEKLYAAGQANYKSGHLEAAKSDFDKAFDTLLSSSLDVRADDRLQREFDKLIEAVHELEMVALKQGDGFTEPRSEPAPIDEANEVTFPVDPNVKAKAEEEVKNTKSDLPLVLNDEVASFINYFSSPRGRITLENAWARSGRYREMIARVLKQEGVPQDLVYLAQAESGFQPLALSRAGARGVWQFMAGTGQVYGLERSWWVDDRQDPEKATRAAARHLKDLYNQFGDWYLAMAAYNSGASTVQHAVERTGYADFWELYRRGVLPRETRNYVPIILAVTIIAKNPEQYGLQRVTPIVAPMTDAVVINYPVDLRLVAECVDTSVDYLQELNPSLLRLTTPKDQQFTLNLPAGSRDKYETAIASIPLDMRTYWRYHRVEYGDTLPSIARKYHVSSSAIAEANNLGDGDVKAGTKLIIPVAPGHRESQTAFSRKPTRYKVRRGDTLASIADDFEVPVDRLRKWNRLRGNTVKPGRTLVIYRPAAADSAEPEVKKASATVRSESSKPSSNGSQTMKYHKVKKGETLSSIAEDNHTSVTALRRDNPDLAATLRAGDVLVIKKQ